MYIKKTFGTSIRHSVITAAHIILCFAINLAQGLLLVFSLKSLGLSFQLLNNK